MIINSVKVICSLIKNWRFYFIIIVSIVMSAYTADNDLVLDGVKMIPTIIGVLLGGLLAAIAIIFGIIRDEDIKLLLRKYGKAFSSSIDLLKDHIVLILINMFLALAAFFIKAPYFILFVLDYNSIPIAHLFYFLEFLFLLLTLYSTVEVINILFLVFNIRMEIIKQNIE